MHIYIYITNDSSFLGEKVNLFFPGYMDYNITIILISVHPVRNNPN